MAKKRKIDLVYMGMFSKDGYFESYTEKQVKNLGGEGTRPRPGDRFLYHHQSVFNLLSPLKNWMEIYAKDSTIRFNRKGRYDYLLHLRGRDNFVLYGEAAMKPFEKQNKKQMSQLASKLVELNVSPKVCFEGALLHLPEDVATHQEKVIGSLEELIK